jgi:cytosine/adenosine deaminase-related metal-dependent hydrolase
VYRKFTASKVFNGFNILPLPHTLVMDEKGVVLDLMEGRDEDAQQVNGMLCPGFINAHGHLELSYLKGKIEEGTGIVPFVTEVLKNRKFPQEEIEQAISTAIAAMEASGIVAMGDICNTTHTAAAKRKSNIRFRNFLEVSGFVDDNAQQRIAEIKKLRNAFEDSYIVPHAPYSVSASLMKLIADEKEKFVSIHFRESEEEEKFFAGNASEFEKLYAQLGVNIQHFPKQKFSPLSWWLPLFDHSCNIISVHNTFITKEDIHNLKASGKRIFFCVCINANQYIERKTPPVEMLMQSGFPLVLGTDSLASNHQLSIAMEAATVHKNFPHIPLEEILRWSTMNGAAALDFSDLGSFEKGKQPGVVELEISGSGKLTGGATRIF